jgi:phage terminase Nu1 subunit (DNA packaging protein)
LTPSSRGLAVSRKQCCDILGWTAYQFDKNVRDGMPVAERPTSRQTDYVVFMGDVIRWIVEQELRAAGHEPDEHVKLDLNAERARLAKAQADKTEMENAVARGELLPAAEVAKADEVVFTALRDRVMQVESVSAVVCDLAVAGKPGEARALLRSALRDALEDVGSAELVEAPAP